MNLGKRLSKVANLLLPVDTLADVGCDHGYLSIYMVEKKKCKHVIAMDVNKDPLQKARENIMKYGCDDYIETRLSDGLNQLKEDEADGVVIAGMGGPLALQILWQDKEKAAKLRQIILQPQSELWLVRRTLQEWGFCIEKEDMEYEDGKYYFMMRIRPGDSLSMEKPPVQPSSFAENKALLWKDAKADEAMSENMLRQGAFQLFGQELLNRKDSLLYDFIIKEEKRLSEVYESLAGFADSDKNRERLEAIRRELEIHRWVLKQYQS